MSDAYGAGFEYAPLNFIKAHNNLFTYVKHPRHRLIPGSYTDDTQMSIAITEMIVYQQLWTRQNLADKFVEAFKRDEREGYSSKFYDFLKRVKTGQQFLAEIGGTSDKSGAAMRAAPIGIFPTIKEVKEKATIQAAITHNSPDGIDAAIASALMSHYCIYNLGEKSKLGKFIETHVPGKPWSEPWDKKVGSKGWMSVRAAITAVERNEKMSSLLMDCINFTGDVDTVATIALAAGSCSVEIVQDLPENLKLLLENGKYGRDFLINLDRQLMGMKV
ncbi:ADP-ribosylglycohydrolase family protein [Okeania sp. SIO3B5]|uniref:ADP-ribosylglycohydrolase family protein n=1 Tax=Okeania sp. SIO3B5 TaxID=2607811 RepID=UPI0025CE4489|nr:ADP-ribosylglycohydrolase family protein [Okeania sp. SIO3B5]